MHWLDPDYLPEHSGTFERFLLNPHGETDGMILSDGTEVHFPPHLSAEMLTAIRLGTKPKVKVRGVRPRGSELIAAVAIDTDGKRILDRGPDKGRDGKKKDQHAATSLRSPLQVEGIVRCVLHGPKGETRGVLLEDGTSIRFPPHEAEHIARLLSKGRKLAAGGDGLESTLGTVIEARVIGPSMDDLHTIKHKKPKHDKHERHDKPGKERPEARSV
jgi:hypothetical protein